MKLKNATAAITTAKSEVKIVKEHTPLLLP